MISNGWASIAEATRKTEYHHFPEAVAVDALVIKHQDNYPFIRISVFQNPTFPIRLNQSLERPMLCSTSDKAFDEGTQVDIDKAAAYRTQKRLKL